MKDDIVWVSNSVRACEIFSAVAVAEIAMKSFMSFLPFFVISLP